MQLCHHSANLRPQDAARGQGAVREQSIQRRLRIEDIVAMFALDSNVEVHRYLGNNPIQTLAQAGYYVHHIQNQYKKNGIGRWHAIEKQSGELMGWSGLKLITEPENNPINYYDVGYRFLPQFWGKGYATESTKAALNYGFEKCKLDKIIGCTNENNKASIRILEKCGLRFVEKFYWKDILCDWMEISKEEFTNWVIR